MRGPNPLLLRDRYGLRTVATYGSQRAPACSDGNACHSLANGGHQTVGAVTGGELSAENAMGVRVGQAPARPALPLAGMCAGRGQDHGQGQDEGPYESIHDDSPPRLLPRWTRKSRRFGGGLRALNSASSAALPQLNASASRNHACEAVLNASVT